MKISIFVSILFIIILETRILHGSPLPTSPTPAASTSSTQRTPPGHQTTQAPNPSYSTQRHQTASRRSVTTPPVRTQAITVQGTTSSPGDTTHPQETSSSRSSTPTSIHQSSEVTSTSLNGNTSSTVNAECHCLNNQTCNTTNSTCAEDTSCDPDMGKCTGECLSGWHGDRCNQEIPPTSRTSDGGSSSLSSRDIAILVLTLLFVSSLAINIIVIVRKVRSNRIASGPTKSYNVAKYKPEEDGQVNLTRGGSLSSLDYQPSAILSGLPDEAYDFVEPEAVTYSRTSRIPPPPSAKVERPRSRLSRGEDPRTELEIAQAEQARPNSLHPVEHGDGPLQNMGEESGEYSMLQSGAHGPGTLVRDVQLNYQSADIDQGQEAPLRPPRRPKQAAMSDDITEAGETSVAYRRDSVDITLRRVSEASGRIMNRRSGAYTAPEDGLDYSGSEFAETSGEEDENYENYQRALKEVGVETKDETEVTVDDDSDPYENEDFMDKLYRQRARKKSVELETSEVTGEHYEDDSDPYENDEDLEEYRERARAREAMRLQEQATGQPDEEFKDDSDPYENDEDIEAYRERAREREAARRQGASTGDHGQDHDDSDLYEDYADMGQVYRPKQETERESKVLSRKYEEDDSDPYENDEDMDEMYKQRVQQRMDERLGEPEHQPEIGETSQACADDDDLYENEDFMEELNRKRISQMSTNSADDKDIQETNTQQDEDDLYENDDFMERMAIRRAERKMKKTEDFDTNASNKFDGYSKVIRRHSEGSNPVPVSNGLALYGTSERLHTICDEDGQQVHTGGQGEASDQGEVREEEEGQHLHFARSLSTGDHNGPGVRGEGSEREPQNETKNYQDDSSNYPAFGNELHPQVLNADDATVDLGQMHDGFQDQGHDITNEQFERDDDVGSHSSQTQVGGFNGNRPERPGDLPVSPPVRVQGQSMSDFETRNHAGHSDDVWSESQTRGSAFVGFHEVDKRSNSFEIEPESPVEKGTWSTGQKGNMDETWSQKKNTENIWPQSPTSDTEGAWPSSPNSDTDNVWPSSPTNNVGFEEDFVEDTVIRRSKYTGSRHAQFRSSVSETDEDGPGSGTDLDRWSRALDTHPRGESPVQFGSDNEEFDA